MTSICRWSRSKNWTTTKKACRKSPAMHGKCRVHWTHSLPVSKNMRLKAAFFCPSWETKKRKAASSSKRGCKMLSCRKVFLSARRTTRFSAWCVHWKVSIPAAPSCWYRKTSTCASRLARWGCPQKSTSTTTYWKTPTYSTPASCNCRMISGTSTARESSRGRKTGMAQATPTTA